MSICCFGNLFYLSKFIIIGILFSRSALRNWDFQVSKDGITWITLFSHKDDTSLNEPG